MLFDPRIVVLVACFASFLVFHRFEPEDLISFLLAAGVPIASSDLFLCSCVAFRVLLNKISVVSEYPSSLASTGQNKTISRHRHWLDSDLETCLAYAKYVSSIRWKTVSEASPDFLLIFREGYRPVTTLRGDSAGTVADSIDNMLDYGLTDSQQRKDTRCKLCGNLHASYIITDGLNKVGERPFRGGGFADVWEGSYRSKKVAIKVPRLYSSTDAAKAKKRFCKEAIIWSRLSHPNVLRFIGVATSPFELCMVSPWMENGDVISYLNSHSQANPIRILRDIIVGLAYLHSMNIIHGDLKGANILIDDNGQACLADFGSTTIIPESIPGYSITTMTNQGTVPWMAPELLAPDLFGLTKCISSKESDMHAFGMVVYEVITRTMPFREHGIPLTVMRKIINGVRPERPTDAITANLVSDLWPLAEECWAQDRDQRPSARQVLKRLNMIID